MCPLASATYQKETPPKRAVAKSEELSLANLALTLAMETSRDYEPEVKVYEAPEGVLNVIIRTIGDSELEALWETPRRAPKRLKQLGRWGLLNASRAVAKSPGGLADD
jgi:hypothetical protein